MPAPALFKNFAGDVVVGCPKCGYAQFPKEADVTAYYENKVYYATSCEALGCDTNFEFSVNWAEAEL